MVASGELKAPVVIGRDHLDCGSVASPYRETEAMLDGSDAIADWAILNALVNTASGATWVSFHHGGGVGIGRSLHAGQVTVADGTDLAAEKIERVLTNDPGMGVIRHVDAGYDRAVEVADERGVTDPDARAEPRWQGVVHGRRRRQGQPPHLPEARARAAVLAKLDGLSEYDVRRPLTATGTNLLGLVKHLATWEARYLGEVFGRPFPEPLPRWDVEAERLADMWATAHESRADVVDRYRRVWAHSDATIEALDARRHGPRRVVGRRGGAAVQRPGPRARRDQPARRPRRHPARGARRAVGTDAEAMAADGHDAAFWAERRAEIEAAARGAAAEAAGPTRRPANRRHFRPVVGQDPSMASGDKKKPARARVVLTDISSRAWEHPADKGALVALRKLKGFDVLLKTMSGVFRERAWRLTLLGSAVRVDERQFARLHRLLAEVGQSLDATELPEMYVQADPTLSAQTVGMDRPIIVLSSGLVHHLDDDELRFVIGHELGHAISGHAVYRTLLLRLLGLGGLLNAIPGGAHRHPDGDRRPARVVAQGRAVGRPRRAARQPGPDRRAAHPHEDRQRRQPRRARRHVVPLPGGGVRRGRRRARVPHQAVAAAAAEPPLRGRPRDRAAPAGSTPVPTPRSSAAPTRAARATTTPR